MPCAPGGARACRASAPCTRRASSALTYALDHAKRAPRGLRGVLASGDRGRDVRVLQNDLVERGFMARADVNGSYDYATEQAVVAVQGVNGITRDGIASAAVRALAAGAPRPKALRGGPAHVEISLSKQVMLLVRKGGVVARAIHVSTGAGGKTPAGAFGVYSKSTYSYSRPFKVWLPYASYFLGGYAMHEYPSVPNYPASHGCVRVPSSEAKRVFAYASMRMPVFVA